MLSLHEYKCLQSREKENACHAHSSSSAKPSYEGMKSLSSRLLSSSLWLGELYPVAGVPWCKLHGARQSHVSLIELSCHWRRGRAADVRSTLWAVPAPYQDRNTSITKRQRQWQGHRKWSAWGIPGFLNKVLMSRGRTSMMYSSASHIDVYILWAAWQQKRNW